MKKLERNFEKSVDFRRKCGIINKLSRKTAALQNPNKSDVPAKTQRGTGQRAGGKLLKRRLEGSKKYRKKCLTNRFYSAIIDYADLRGCWNRQTGKLEVLVSVLACGFKSHFPHQCKGHSIFECPLFLYLGKSAKHYHRKKPHWNRKKSLISW